MVAIFNNRAVIQHDNTVQMGEGGQAMGNDQHGLVGHDVVKAVLDQAFGLGIEAGGGFVQHQDRRVLEQRPGNGDALALPSRQFDPAFANQGVVAFGHLQNKLVGMRPLRGLGDLLIAGLHVAITNVFAQ